VHRRALKVSLIFGIALVALIVTWTGLSDYVKRAENCFPELGQYGDQRLIDVAIEYEISRHQRKIDYDNAPGLIQYKSIEDFKARNEKCCTIDRSRHEYTSDLGRALGDTEVWVNFWYRAADEGPEPFYQSDVGMNACGKVFASRGMSISVGPVAK